MVLVNSDANHGVSDVNEMFGIGTYLVSRVVLDFFLLNLTHDSSGKFPIQPYVTLTDSKRCRLNF